LVFSSAKPTFDRAQSARTVIQGEDVFIGGR
jgi:hypothetical protein